MQCVWRCRDFRDSIVQLDPDEMPNDEGNREFWWPLCIMGLRLSLLHATAPM